MTKIINGDFNITADRIDDAVFERILNPDRDATTDEQIMTQAV